MKYQVVIGPDLVAVVNQVNDMLAEGWICQGGIAMSYSGSTRYAQAMLQHPAEATRRQLDSAANNIIKLARRDRRSRVKLRHPEDAD